MTDDKLYELRLLCQGMEEISSDFIVTKPGPNELLDLEEKASRVLTIVRPALEKPSELIKCTNCGDEYSVMIPEGGISWCGIPRGSIITEVSLECRCGTVSMYRSPAQKDATT